MEEVARSYTFSEEATVRLPSLWSWNRLSGNELSDNGAFPWSEKLERRADRFENLGAAFSPLLTPSLWQRLFVGESLPAFMHRKTPDVSDISCLIDTGPPL
jgi:hypothetical protein